MKLTFFSITVFVLLKKVLFCNMNRWPRSPHSPGTETGNLNCRAYDQYADEVYFRKHKFYLNDKAQVRIQKP